MDPDRRHLALSLYGLSGSGAQRRMLTLAHAFAARGHQVDLVAVRSHGPLLRELSPLVRLVTLGPWQPYLLEGKNRRGRWALTGVPALAHYLRREQPEVLLSTSHFSNVTATWAWSLARTSTKLVVRVSNHLSRSLTHTPSLRRWFELWPMRYFYTWADAIIAVSKGIADDVAQVTRVPRERITMIYNPMITPELQENLRVPLTHPWFTPDSPPVLLGVGRLVAQKDFPTLLKAFARMRATREVRLMILGEGRKRAALEALARKLGVAGDVALPGFVVNPFPYMVRASALVLSSAWEGLPGVLIEAMSCGCPVVSTDCPSGPAEILDGGVYGPLVPIGDDAALAQATLSVLDAPLDAERLRARAAMFSVDRAVDQYLEVLLGSQ